MAIDYEKDNTESRSRTGFANAIIGAAGLLSLGPVGRVVGSIVGAAAGTIAENADHKSDNSSDDYSSDD